MANGPEQRPGTEGIVKQVKGIASLYPRGINYLRHRLNRIDQYPRRRVITIRRHHTPEDPESPILPPRPEKVKEWIWRYEELSLYIATHPLSAEDTIDQPARTRQRIEDSANHTFLQEVLYEIGQGEDVQRIDRRVNEQKDNLP